MYVLKRKKDRLYVLYHGEELIKYGTLNELAEFLKVKLKTIEFYNSDVYKKRNKNGYAVTIIPEDEEEKYYEIREQYKAKKYGIY